VPACDAALRGARRRGAGCELGRAALCHALLVPLAGDAARARPGLPLVLTARFRGALVLASAAVLVASRWRAHVEVRLQPWAGRPGVEEQLEVEVARGRVLMPGLAAWRMQAGLALLDAGLNELCAHGALLSESDLEVSTPRRCKRLPPTGGGGASASREARATAMKALQVTASQGARLPPLMRPAKRCAAASPRARACRAGGGLALCSFAAARQHPNALCRHVLVLTRGRCSWLIALSSLLVARCSMLVLALGHWGARHVRQGLATAMTQLPAPDRRALALSLMRRLLSRLAPDPRFVLAWFVLACVRVPRRLARLLRAWLGATPAWCGSLVVAVWRVGACLVGARVAGCL
jgi:hypothetical protein